MRRLLIWGCYLFLLLSCRQNEIEEYTEIPRIGFENSSNLGYVPERYILFTDEDYLKQVTEKTDSVKVELMGKALDESRTCCFRKVEETDEEQALQMNVPDEIVVRPGIYSVYLKYKVYCPKFSGREYSSVLEFDTERPEHGFAVGKSEGNRVRIIGEFRLKPIDWNNYFGVYSDGKYRFMLDFFGGIYSSIGNTAENRRLIREAYAEYRLTNDAIVDDNGEEILFP